MRVGVGVGCCGGGTPIVACAKPAMTCPHAAMPMTMATTHTCHPSWRTVIATHCIVCSGPGHAGATWGCMQRLRRVPAAT